jgi:hypothetical protein
MTKLWESESVSLDANKIGVYGHTRTKQPNGAVYIAPKIEGGSGSPSDLKLEVTKIHFTKDKKGIFGYWITVKNASNSNMSFKIQVYELT